METKQSSKRKQKTKQTEEPPARPPTITIDKEVDGFIRATAAHYGRSFETVLNIVLRAGMRTVINSMIGSEELEQLTKSRLILEPFDHRLRREQLNPASKIIQP